MLCLRGRVQADMTWSDVREIKPDAIYSFQLYRIQQG